LVRYACIAAIRSSSAGLMLPELPQLGEVAVAAERWLGGCSTRRSQDFVRRREKVKAQLLDAVAPVRRRALEQLRDAMKRAAIADPDMWECMKAAVGNAVDVVVEQVGSEIEERLKKRMLRQVSEESHAHEPAGRCRCFVRLRAVILHHFLPHDRSIFGNLKDPLWWLFAIPLLLPCYNIRVTAFTLLLFLHCYPCPPDEYQLTNFILQLKATQFLSAGIGAMTVGAFNYFFCFSASEQYFVPLLKCVYDNAMGGWHLEFSVFDYLGSFLLTQAAFGSLQCSRLRRSCIYIAHHPDRSSRTDAAERPATEAPSRCRCCPRCCCAPRGSRHAAPNRVRWLVRYDAACFVVSLMLLGLLIGLTWDQQFFQRSGPWGWFMTSLQLRANVYWCKVVYAFFSFPFLFLICPLATINFSLLMRDVPTGYNEHGACVLFHLLAPREEEELSESDDGASSSGEDGRASSQGGGFGALARLGVRRASGAGRARSQVSSSGSASSSAGGSRW